MTDAAVSYPSSVSVDIGASGSLNDHMPGSGNPTLGTLTGVTMRTFPHLDPVCRYVHKCLLIFRSSAVCFSMLSMCVLTWTDPLQSLYLVLSSTLFSIYIPPKHHTNKDHSISSKYQCSGHGICRSMAEAARNYNGHSLTHPPVFYTNWEADKIQGCLCDAGWDGYDCSQRQCPWGRDPQDANIRYVFKYSGCCTHETDMVILSRSGGGIHILLFLLLSLCVALRSHVRPLTDTLTHTSHPLITHITPPNNTIQTTHPPTHRYQKNEVFAIECQATAGYFAIQILDGFTAPIPFDAGACVRHVQVIWIRVI